MSLRDKLARLPPMPSARNGAVGTSAPPATDDRSERLRGMLDALIARQQAGLRNKVASTSVVARELPGEVEATPEGPVRVRRRYLAPDHAHGRVRLEGAVALEASLVSALAGREPLPDRATERLLFLDTETTGLAGGTGTLAFLAGLGWFENESFVVEQLFLPRPGEERAMLLRIKERILASTLLVTFNGKSYDWPLLKSRFTMNRLDPPPVPAHLDLLTAARRVYRARLGGVRLVRLEEEVLGFRRERDIEGHEIPSLYWSYLRGEEAPDLPIVFEHNENDVVAMVALLAELHAALRAPRAGDAPSDHLGLARIAHRAADAERALGFALQAVVGGGEPPISRAAHLLAARLLCKSGAFERAAALLESALESEDAPELHLALAKLYEHRLKDPGLAARHARHSLGAEDAIAQSRRLSRLETRLRRSALER